MRVFLALHPDEQSEKRLLAWIEDLKGEGVKGRGVNGESLHVTLAFLDEQSEQDIETVEKVLEKIPFSLQSFTPSGFGLFCNALVLKLDSSDEFQNYVRELRKSLKEAGIVFKDGPFQAHVTLFRGVKNRKEPIVQRLLEKNPAWINSAESMQFGMPGLYASELLPSGARYTLLFEKE